MFDDLIRELGNLEPGSTISVPVETDAEGYVDKECPSENCQFQFKVLSEDWGELFGDDAVNCPLCGHRAPSASWWTAEQIEHAKREAREYVEGIIGSSLHKAVRDFNRSQPTSGFIRMSMEWNGRRATRAIIPVHASEPLDLKITCAECSARFSVVGSAFFCPCCGHNSVERMFDDALSKVRVKVEAVPLIKEVYEQQGKNDEGELVARTLLETSLADCVVAFQMIAEQLYTASPHAQQAPMNVFQRIDDGSRLWKQATGKSYENWLTSTELTDLRFFFQRRHLFAHAEGIVDQRYLDRSGDASYSVGQRIVVKQMDVLRMVELIGKLVAAMKTADVPNQ